MPKKKKLKRKLIPIPNPDKKFHEKWKKNNPNPLDFPHPFRIVLSGSVNCGKTTVIKNLLLRQQKPFREIYLIHCDADYTTEYDDCNVKILKTIPSPKFWVGIEKTMVIIDDIDYKGLNKEEQSNLDRLMGFCSTHKNISVAITCQDFFRLSPSIKRMSNIFVIWKSNDELSFKAISRKCGLNQAVFTELFDNFLNEPRDSLWVDLTEKSPYPLRKNGFDLIIKKKIKII